MLFQHSCRQCPSIPAQATFTELLETCIVSKHMQLRELSANKKDMGLEAITTAIMPFLHTLISLMGTTQKNSLAGGHN